jgi:hypothetical protein
MPTSARPQAHLVTQVGEVVDRRHREVAPLHARLVAQVAALLDPAGVPHGGLGVEVVVALVGRRLEPHVVEDEELRLGAEVGRVGDPRRLEVGLGLGRDVARVAAVGLVGERVDDREVHDQGLLDAERVEVGRRHVGQELHVRLVDRLEPADRAAVEGLADGEEVLVQRVRRNVEVLHDPGQVTEPDVDELDVLALMIGQDLVG